MKRRVVRPERPVTADRPGNLTVSSRRSTQRGPASARSPETTSTSSVSTSKSASARLANSELFPVPLSPEQSPGATAYHDGATMKHHMASPPGEYGSDRCEQWVDEPPIVSGIDQARQMSPSRCLGPAARSRTVTKIDRGPIVAEECRTRPACGQPNVSMHAPVAIAPPRGDQEHPRAAFNDLRAIGSSWLLVESDPLPPSAQSTQRDCGLPYEGSWSTHRVAEPKDSRPPTSLRASPS